MKTAWLFVLYAGLYFSTADANEISQQRQNELEHLVLHDCGSCHGMTLKGGLGPSLTRDTLIDRAPEALVATVAYGRLGTPMPPFRDILSDAEIRWIVDYLLQEKN